MNDNLKERVEYLGYQFDLSDYIDINSNVILTVYRGSMMLLSYTSTEDIDTSIILEYIPTMPGFSIVANSPVGKLDVDVDEVEKCISVFVDDEFIVDIYSKDNFNQLTFPTVMYLNHNYIYAFNRCSFEYNLRGVNDVTTFTRQINQLTYGVLVP